MEKKLFLLDAYALIYRAYYALIRSPRITSYGFNTSAIFGFINTLEEVLKKENPTHLAVCFDPHGPTFRHEAFKEYKAKRQEQPEDITLSLPYIKEILAARNIPAIEIPGYEADDVIGTLSRKAEKEGFVTYMMTPDKDYGQLVTPKVFMYKPSLRGQDFELRGVDEIKEKYGISSPSQVIDMLALEGDSIDNIPGCPGIGPKTAIKLIQEFGSVENLISNVECMKGVIKQKIENNAEQIIFSKFLATIKTDIDISISFDDLKIGTPDYDKLIKIYEKLEFRSFLNKLSKDIPKESEKSTIKPIEEPSMGLFDDLVNKPNEKDKISTILDLPVEIRNITTKEELLLLENKIINDRFFAFAVKSVGENAISGNLISLAFTCSNNENWFLKFPGEIDFEERNMTLSFLRKIFNDPNLTAVGEDIKRTIVLFSQFDIEFYCKYFDISLADYLLDPEARHLLPEVAHRRIAYDTVEYSVEPRNRHTYDIPSILDHSALLCEQSSVSYRLYAVLKEELRTKGLEKLYYDIENPLIKALAQMEINGVRIDIKELRRLSDAYTVRLNEMEEKVYEMAGCRFNLGSPSQVGDILFDKLAIDSKAKKTKKGSYSTTEEILEKYRIEYPIVDLILKIRQLRKLLTTYINALPEMVNPRTGKIHTTYNQTVTSTGRLSSTNPNLQNIPVRGDDGKEIRRAFIADNGCLFMSADYSQIELRLMADLSKDPYMLQAFSNNQDIHQATAARIYHKSLDDVTSDERRNAKTANFGIIYGISAFGLSERLGIPRSEAKQLIEDYMKTYPAVQEYITNIIEKAKKQGFVTTFTGRKRMLPEINSRNAVVRGYGERNAVNAPLQGSAADIIKIAMVSIDRALRENNMKSTMIMQVHDELIFNVFPEELPHVQSIVASEMEKAYKGEVKLTTSIGVGVNWLEAH